MSPCEVGTICCIFVHPSEEGQRGSFIVIFVNGVPANGSDCTCFIANCSVKLAGCVLPVDPLEIDVFEFDLDDGEDLLEDGLLYPFVLT